MTRIVSAGVPVCYQTRLVGMENPKLRVRYSGHMLAKRSCAWALLVAVAAAGLAARSAELPPAIQVDRLLIQADRQMQQDAAHEALATLDAATALRAEHGLATPDEFWYRYAVVTDRAGHHERAVEYATSYLAAAGQQGEHYEAALRLLDAAEQAVEEDRRKQEAERSDMGRSRRAEFR